MARALVIGGGIAGLACANDLLGAGMSVTLVDPADRLGGKIRTDRLDGFLVESGPDSFVAYRPAAAALAGELGLAGQIISTTQPRLVHLRRDGQMVAMPDGMGLILPTKLGPFVGTKLLGWPAKLRAGADLLLPRSLGPADTSIGSFLRHRLGPAMVARLADPLLGGVYGTSVDELSLDAVLPQLREYEREHRSLLLASLAQGRAARGRARAAGTPEPGGAGGSGGSPFRSLAGGMGSLVDALAERMLDNPDFDLRLGRGVSSLSRSGSRTSARLADGATLAVDAVVIAAPAAVAAGLLSDTVPGAAGPISQIRHGSTAVVSLGYDEAAFPEPLAGHGFLEAGPRPAIYSGATYSSLKWAGRAPDGAVLLRCFLPDRSTTVAGGADAEVFAAVAAELAATLGITRPPVLRHVARWTGLMPKYTVGHLERIATIEQQMRPLLGWYLAGASYRGVGVPDCIASGRAAAASVLDLLSGAPQDGGHRPMPAESGAQRASGALRTTGTTQG